MADERQELTKRDPGTAEVTRQGRVYVPAADIYEREDALVVVADVPGASEKDLDISVENRVLTIHAPVNTQRPEGYGLVYSEYEPGHYRRAFALTDDVDVGRIEASLRDGVLRIVLPKSETARPKKIQITTA